MYISRDMYRGHKSDKTVCHYSSLYLLLIEMCFAAIVILQNSYKRILPLEKSHTSKLHLSIEFLLHRKRNPYLLCMPTPYFVMRIFGVCCVFDTEYIEAVTSKIEFLRVTADCVHRFR
jgi:hypothetical protein